MSMRSHGSSLNDASSNEASSDQAPVRNCSNSPEFKNLAALADWRKVPFLIIDSAETRRFEDAVATRAYPEGRHWTTDLKVVHPLPLTDSASLREGERQVCLGIRDKIDPGRFRQPLVSLVIAESLTRVTERQARAVLNGQGQSIGKLGGKKDVEPLSGPAIESRLKLVRATALRVSPWVSRDLTPAHCVALLTTHAQGAAIRASRKMKDCPTLIVLRPEGLRNFTNLDAQKAGINAQVKGGAVELPAGKMVPTPLRTSEEATDHDTLRLKERSNSGAINMTQLTCALLGIEPIPDALVEEGLRSDSERDTWSRGGPLPDSLATALAKRRAEIREVLRTLSVR